MRYISTLIFILFTLLAFGQNSELVNNALIAYKDGELLKAQQFIEEALNEEGAVNNAEILNFKGHIFKQKYKVAGQQLDSQDRDIAVESFMASCAGDGKEKYAEDNFKALEFLAATYFNDAVKGAIEVKYNASDDPVVYFQKFKELKKWMNPEEDLVREELQFLKMLAQGFEKMHRTDQNKEFNSMEKAVEYYKKALEIDPEDYEANFNLAIVYYNEGADLIGKIDYRTGFSELLDIQKKCVSMFKTALPYMETADVIRPNKIKTLKGLMFIHRALNNFDKYLQYKIQLEEILKN